MIYGYCRVSAKTQNIERQERNIKTLYPDAAIVREAFTGTKVYERKVFTKLIGNLKSGDTLVFDSVSRMSRNADEGVTMYMELFSKGIELVFLKERYIDTQVYASNLKDRIQLTGAIEDEIFKGINSYFRMLAEKQIRIAFEQAEKEVTDLQQRTREGMVTAKLNGKQIGIVAGTKLITKKSIAAKEIIRNHSKTFGGSLSDKECIKLCGVTSKTYYLYKKQLKESEL
ncbi:MAG: recombinase family protein [Fibrobacteraceae bacterium]|nr:recombinase family protein [Fibrobacteraceae bacterium]MBR6622277.1 recombinase family protein [Ruminococcus sp.]